MVQLYDDHTAHHTAGELLAAAVTTSGKLIFVSNKQAARPGELGILTSWGGKPDAEVVARGKVRIEGVYDTIRREGIEECGVDIEPFVDRFETISYRLLTIGEDSEKICTPMPLNVNEVFANLTRL